MSRSHAVVATGDASLNEAVCSGKPFWYAAAPHKIAVRQALLRRVAGMAGGGVPGKATPLSAAARLVLSWWGWVEFGVEGGVGALHLGMKVGSMPPTACSGQQGERDSASCVEEMRTAQPHNDWLAVQEQADAFQQLHVETAPGTLDRPASVLETAFQLVSAELQNQCCNLDSRILEALQLDTDCPVSHCESAVAASGGTSL